MLWTFLCIYVFISNRLRFFLRIVLLKLIFEKRPSLYISINVLSFLLFWLKHGIRGCNFIICLCFIVYSSHRISNSDAILTFSQIRWCNLILTREFDRRLNSFQFLVTCLHDRLTCLIDCIIGFNCLCLFSFACQSKFRPSTWRISLMRNQSLHIRFCCRRHHRAELLTHIFIYDHLVLIVRCSLILCKVLSRVVVLVRIRIWLLLFFFICFCLLNNLFIIIDSPLQVHKRRCNHLRASIPRLLAHL